jgi:hypothetical protein
MEQCDATPAMGTAVKVEECAGGKLMSRAEHRTEDYA